MDKNPAFDPLVKGRKIGDYLDAATRMYALINQSGARDQNMPRCAFTLSLCPCKAMPWPLPEVEPSLKT